MAHPETAFGLTLGDRIELISMEEDPDPIEPGTRGTVVRLVESYGYDQIGVKWDNGRTLCLIPDFDKFKKIEE